MASQDLEHDTYARALDTLEALDRRLAMAAAVVDTLHPGAAALAGRVLAYAEHRFPDRDVLSVYADRARQLARLQDRFDAAPAAATIGAPEASVDRDAYTIALLLSIPLTNHRFEIMRELDSFLAGCDAPGGRIASIGTGTGFELEKMARLPGGWTIESYDIDERVQAEARDFLDYFGITRPIVWGREFPLAATPPAFRGRYDALVLCEVLEHLADPASALGAVRESLTPGGRAFVTMAVNIAQEDHVYWYPDVAACRAQIAGARLRVASEWITPQTTLPPPADREAAFKKGNYVATVTR
jgi:2-polyprenyl-3-methyl-5-hydroxy-6-metoxy-1,4-benzoquinol methylase